MLLVSADIKYDDLIYCPKIEEINRCGRVPVDDIGVPELDALHHLPVAKNDYRDEAFF